MLRHVERGVAMQMEGGGIVGIRGAGQVSGLPVGRRYGNRARHIRGFVDDRHIVGIYRNDRQINGAGAGRVRRVGNGHSEGEWRGGLLRANRAD